MTARAELDATAAKLDELAATVGPLLDRVAAFHRPDVWRGRRADRFGQELDDRRAELSAVVRDLEAGACRLRAEAGRFGPC